MPPALSPAPSAARSPSSASPSSTRTTVGNSVRLLILVAVYVLLVFFGGLPLVLLAILGIAEAFLHLRARRLRGAPPLT